MPARISPGCARRGRRSKPLPGDMPTHAEQRVLPYTPQQLFDLVADVERYPEFLPWCVGARIRERASGRILADLIIGFKLIRERFTSEVRLDPPQRIEATYTEGPFRYLNNHWGFTPVAGGCRIDFFVDFEFRSRLLTKVIEVVFGEAVRRMVGAFERRARDLYGAPPAAASTANSTRTA
jgi:coenzyme Q-binding protein COQ10